MAVVTLAFHAKDAALPDSSGFLVPPVDGRRIKASTFSFAKWDWVREAGLDPVGGDDLVLLRTSLGRHREEAALQATDDELVAVVARRPAPTRPAPGPARRQPRAALGRRPPAVRRRPPRPGRPDPRRPSARLPVSRSAAPPTTASASRPSSPPPRRAAEAGVSRTTT